MQNRRVSFGLMIAVFLAPMIFAWFLVREGYSTKAKFFAFSWLVFGVLASTMSKMVLGVI